MVHVAVIEYSTANARTSKLEKAEDDGVGSERDDGLLYYTSSMHTLLI